MGEIDKGKGKESEVRGMTGEGREERDSLGRKTHYDKHNGRERRSYVDDTHDRRGESLHSRRRKWREDQNIHKSVYRDNRRDFVEDKYYRETTASSRGRYYYSGTHRSYGGFEESRRRRVSEYSGGSRFSGESVYDRPDAFPQHESGYRYSRSNVDELSRDEEHCRLYPSSSQDYPNSDCKYKEGRREKYKSYDMNASKRGKGECVEEPGLRSPSSRQDIYQGGKECGIKQDLPHEPEKFPLKPKRNFSTNTLPSKAIGLFGLSIHATEDDVKDFLKEKISEIQDYKIIIVYDKYRKVSKGYGFIYFDALDDAITAKGRLMGQMLKGKEVRVDYSTNGPLKFPRDDRSQG